MILTCSQGYDHWVVGFNDDLELSLRADLSLKITRFLMQG